MKKNLVINEETDKPVQISGHDTIGLFAFEILNEKELREPRKKF